MQQTFAPIEIIDVQETRIAILPHSGDPTSIGKTIRRFIDWRKSAGLPPRLSATYNIFHNDPQEVALADFRLDLCVATDRNVVDAELGIVAGVIPARAVRRAAPYWPRRRLRRRAVASLCAVAAAERRDAARFSALLPAHPLLPGRAGTGCGHRHIPAAGMTTRVIRCENAGSPNAVSIDFRHVHLGRHRAADIVGVADALGQLDRRLGHVLIGDLRQEMRDQLSRARFLSTACTTHQGASSVWVRASISSLALV